MKMSATRRALILANIFNSLVALYFIIIAIVALAQLRWYHQLTITVKVRHILTLTTSYFAFILLIVVGLILLGLFVSSALRLTGNKQRRLAPNLEHSERVNENNNENNNADNQTSEIFTDVSRVEFDVEVDVDGGSENQQQTRRSRRAVVLRDFSLSEESNSSVCCSILVHLVVTIGLIIILLIWLFNTGELVRDSISTQLDYALARYQFSNRSNYYSIAIDGIQDINNCCGSLEYSDFPRQRISGLSAGLYPGSCCGKSVFGVNANQHCRAEEIWRAKQTTGCTTVLANYYDLISLLIVPVALLCLFVNITIIALITISKRGNNSNSLGGHHERHLTSELDTRRLTHTNSRGHHQQQQQQQQQARPQDSK